MVKPIDGAALRKESWILGQCADTYKTVQMVTHAHPSVNSRDHSQDAANARALKAKVAGTSIKNESPSSMTDPNIAFQTNTQIVHKHLGEINQIDQSVRDAQRSKLTKANFIVGKSPQYYATTS